MPRWFLFFTAFCTGMATMALEMAASRFLAPYFGTTIFVWANIIGLVLIALSLGYFVGGKLADRNQNPKKLFLAIFLTGVLTDVIPFVGRPLLQNGLKNTGEIFGSFIAVSILFALPLFLLGMVSPWIIRLAARKIEEVGRIAGRVYGISTIGSIVGVFLPVFVTIPFLGTQETIFLFGTLLLLLGVLGMTALHWSWLILPLLSLTLLFYPEIIFQKDPSIIAHAESLYNFLSIRKIDDWFFLQMNAKKGVQSAYHPKEILTGQYWDYAVLPPLLNPGGKNYLIIGLGAGTSSRILQHYFPHLKLTGVEIDGTILDLGKKYFDLEKQNIRLITEDGRRFLTSSQEKYDFIMIDVYAQEYVIPFHLATGEFFQSVKQNLTENGIIIMNVAVFPERGKILEPLKNTFASIFENSVSFSVPGTSNTFLMYGRYDLGNAPEALRPLIDVFQAGKRLLVFDPGQLIFTDNRAPIEWLSQ